MYSIGGVRRGYQRMWGAIARECPDLPRTLTWPDDVHATWTDDDVVVKQCCGWPLVTALGSTVRVVGAFEHDVPGSSGYRYRSVIVSTRAASPDDVSSSRMAVNSADSLSGWVSLVVWSGRPAGSLWSQAVESGSHVASLQLLREGVAELASIDAVTFEHVRRHWPVLLSGLEVVGEGPLVPSLPLVVPADDHALVAPVRRAVGRVVEADALAPTLADLRITGFVPLDFEDYRRELEPLAGAMTG